MRLSREKIQRMIDASSLNTSVRRSGGGGAGGGGGVSSTWVDEHYVSKEFFARLFTINGTDENDDDVVVEPNDLETTITNIQMMVGAWTEQYLSALGLSDGGSGGGATTLAGLTDVDLTNPTPGQALVYRNSHWVNETISATGDYLPLSAGSTKKLTGSLYLSSRGKGIFMPYSVSGSSVDIPLIYDNGDNLWIGATMTTGTHHVGETFISAGTGEVYISRLVNGARTNYKVLDNGNTYVNSGVGYINGTQITALYDNITRKFWNQTYWQNGKPVSSDVTGALKGSGSITIENTGTAASLFIAKNGTGEVRFAAYETNRGIWDGTGSAWLIGTGPAATNPNTFLMRGNVGIGTDSPSYKLDVSGTGRFSGDLLMESGKYIKFKIGSDYTSALGVWGTGYNLLQLGYYTASEKSYATNIYGNTLRLYGSASTLGMLIDTSGNVGVGMSSPDAKLDVNGQLRATTYLSCHNVVGENGTAGWVCFAIVAVSSAWATQPLKFKVSQRGRLGGEITLRFAGVNAASNTTVQEFSYTGNIRAARVVRNGANFSLYIQKHEEYDDIAISLVNLGTYMSSKVTVTWTNSLSSSDPGGTAATCRYYFSNTAYMEWDETNSAVHFVNAGVYSDTFVSALGANSSGGGGGVNLNTLLTSLNSTSLNPATVSNKVLVNSSGTWTWQDYIAGGGGGGSVTSVGLSMPTGFSITGTNPITGSGTFTVTANGTMVPDLNADKLDGYEASGLFETLKNSTASGHTNDIEIKIGNTTKYLTVGYATSAGSATTAGSASTAGSATTAGSCTGNAATASKLSGNASGPFTAWGNTFWNNGVPQSVSGDMSSVGNITAMTESNNYTKVITGFHSLTLRHNGSNGGHLDFFWNGASSYTSRIIEGGSKRLDINDTIFVFHANSSSNAGCVGIGTTNPGYTLNVNGYTYTYRLYLASGVYLEYDNNGGVHLVGAGFYADTFVSALGANSSSGGGGIDLNTMWNALENNASGHSIGTSTNGLNALYATSIYANGVQVLTSSNGVTIATAQTISGAKTFSGNLLAKKIQMTASNAATYLEHTKLYSPNATMTIQGSDSAQNLTLCTGGGNVSIGTAADANYRLKVSGSSLFDGNVGIGGYSSNHKLYVSGNAKIQGDFLVKDFKINSYIPSGSSQVCYQIGYQYTSIYTLGSWSSGSDLRRKDILAYSECSLEDVAHAPIFDFAWKGDKSVTPHLGTSAQYWKNVFSNAVSVGPDDYLAMDYGATALAAAVMTARKVVDHEARIKQLEKEIELLKAMQS